MKRTKSVRILGRVLVGALLAGLLTVVLPQAEPFAERAEALNGADFDAGNIISDSIFFNANSMNESQVQAFLNSVVPNCAGANGWPCLKNLVTGTTSRAAVGGTHCAAYQGAPAESAARIIVKVAQACGINPQVLIVMLQKEQGLVTATSPTERQYRVAMGYACPDTAPCDTAYYGFYNQVYMAAWQLRQYTNFPDRTYRIGEVRIPYHPNSACGSSIVNIRNQATANLYNYTPYRPNAAALANLSGTGDACSAYGNRNFWVYMNTWFPSTLVPDVPFGNFELGTTTINSATVRGWTIDPNTAQPISVHLYVNGKWGGEFSAGRARLDVAQAYPQSGPHHGFEFTFPVGQGTFDACIYAINVGPGYNQLLGCRTLSTPSGPPIGNIDTSALSNRSVALRGWAIDPDTPASIDIHAYVNGAWGGSYRADKSRTDVAAAYRGYGDLHGFDVSLRVPVGTSTICLYGINQGAGYNQSIGCRTVSTASGPPFGNLESVEVTTTGARVTGWVIDPDTENPTSVHIYVNGRWGGAYAADALRTDVAAVYAGYGASHGIRADVPVPPGTSTVCVYAIDVIGSSNPLLGCRSVTRPGGPPFGSLDSASGAPGILNVSGWVIDPDTADPVAVHVYVDNQWGGSFVADIARADVGRAYPNAGADHGYQATLAVPSGRHEVCVFAINVGTGYNTRVGCAVVQS